MTRPFNRVSQYFPRKTSTPSMNAMEPLFSGPAPLQSLVHEAVEETLSQQSLPVEKIRKEERQAVVKEIEQREQKALLEYFFEIAMVGFMVEAAANEFVPSLKIKEYRARCDFRSRSYNLYFVVQASLEDEKKFSSVLDEIEEALLSEQNQIVEIFYSNTRKEIDYAALKVDYPFLFDLQKLKDAIQSATSRTSATQP